MSNYSTPVSSQNHFAYAPFSTPEHSGFVDSFEHVTTFNAGDIVPIAYFEILPEDDLSLSVENVIRQSTLLTPTMGQMICSLHAYWVPNRVVNNSFKAVQGENLSGSWIANNVSLAPLVGDITPSKVQVPVGSVADYYGFPTQQPLPKSVLELCNDLKFRGYVSIYNEFFRDQNYQPPIPMSTLNVYQGFFDPETLDIPLNGKNGTTDVVSSTIPDGSFGAGAVAQSLFGSGLITDDSNLYFKSKLGSFRALSAPLKANKLHDYFTSVLPSPQKGPSVFVPVVGDGALTGTLPVFCQGVNNFISYPETPRIPIGVVGLNGGTPGGMAGVSTSADASTLDLYGTSPSGNATQITFANLRGVLDDVTVSGLEVNIRDIRYAAAVQQYYEILARGGSRYREIVQSLFGVTVDDPFDDVPKCLCREFRPLELFQSAQTSASQDGSSPQGNLAAFGYTHNKFKLFSKHFLEHGYVHIFAVVRHHNIYSSMMSRDNFRLNGLDFFTPPFANVSDQPIFTREINPFSSSPNGVFGYQEPWAEYRYNPNRVSGYMRPGINQSLSVWNYADDFDSSISVANGEWLKSNSAEVLNRTLAHKIEQTPQFKAQFLFDVYFNRSMPVYSVPGMDFI